MFERRDHGRHDGLLPGLRAATGGGPQCRPRGSPRQGLLEAAARRLQRRVRTAEPGASARQERAAADDPPVFLPQGREPASQPLHQQPAPAAAAAAAAGAPDARIRGRPHAAAATTAAATTTATLPAAAAATTTTANEPLGPFPGPASNGRRVAAGVGAVLQAAGQPSAQQPQDQAAAAAAAAATAADGAGLRERRLVGRQWNRWCVVVDGYQSHSDAGRAPAGPHAPAGGENDRSW